MSYIHAFNYSIVMYTQHYTLPHSLPPFFINMDAQRFGICRVWVQYSKSIKDCKWFSKLRSKTKHSAQLFRASHRFSEWNMFYLKGTVQAQAVNPFRTAFPIRNLKSKWFWASPQGIWYSLYDGDGQRVPTLSALPDTQDHSQSFCIIPPCLPWSRVNLLGLWIAERRA